MSTAVPSRALAPLRRASPSSSSLEKAAAKSRKNACGARREAGRQAWAGSSGERTGSARRAAGAECHAATAPPACQHAPAHLLILGVLLHVRLELPAGPQPGGKGAQLAGRRSAARSLPAQHTGTHLSHSSHMSVLSIINWPLLSSYCRQEREVGQQDGEAVRPGPPARAAACAQPGC